MLLGARKRNRRKSARPGAGPMLAWLRPLAGRGMQAAAVLALLIGLAAMSWGVLLWFDRPLAKVQVAGHFQRVAPVQIEEAVAPFRGAGFLSVDLQALQTALQGIAWVDRARVERQWPNAVRVVVTEHVPAARWGADGLINTRGELFLRGARHVPAELPQLSGPPGSHSRVAQLYLQTYPRLLGVGMRLTRVDLDARGAWQLTLASGAQVRLGRQDVAERLERFIRLASPLVAARARDVSHVDLRYSSGFSIGWHEPARVARDAEDATPDV